MYSDLEALTPEQYMKVITRKLTDIKAVHSPEQRGVFIQVLEQMYRFTLGSFAGGQYDVYLLIVNIIYLILNSNCIFIAHLLPIHTSVLLFQSLFRVAVPVFKLS